MPAASLLTNADGQRPHSSLGADEISLPATIPCGSLVAGLHVGANGEPGKPITASSERCSGATNPTSLPRPASAGKRQGLKPEGPKRQRRFGSRKPGARACPARAPLSHVNYRIGHNLAKLPRMNPGEDIVRFHSLRDRLEEMIGGKRMLCNCSGRMSWPRRGVYFFSRMARNAPIRETARVSCVLAPARRSGTGCHIHSIKACCEPAAAIIGARSFG